MVLLAVWKSPETNEDYIKSQVHFQLQLQLFIYLTLYTHFNYILISQWQTSKY